MPETRQRRSWWSRLFHRAEPVPAEPTPTTAAVEVPAAPARVEAPPVPVAPTAAQQREQQAAQTRQRHLAVIDTPTRRHHIVVSSLKGGVAKTTTTLALGTAFGLHRRDTPCAIDANPHRGTLADRTGAVRLDESGEVVMESSFTARDLAHNAERVQTAGDFRAFVNQAPSRFEVIASDPDPEDAAAFSDTDYLRALNVIERFRQVILTDTGIDLNTPLMRNLGSVADTLVVPATTAADAAQLALETIDWWDARGYHELVENAVITITQIEAFTPPVSMRFSNHTELAAARREFNLAAQAHQRDLATRFRNRLGAKATIVFIPHDPHLVGGSDFIWDQLHPRTRDAYIALAAAVASRFKPL